MSPRFIVQSTMSEEFIRLLSSLMLKRPRSIILRVIRFLVGAIELNVILPYLSDLMFLQFECGEDHLSFIIFFAVFSLIFLWFVLDSLFFIRLRVRRSYRKLYKNEMGQTTVYTFYDDHCTRECPGSTSSMQYDLIQTVKEYRDAIGLLCPSENKELILPRNAFTLGTAEELCSFLTKEKGRPFKKLR